MGPKWEMHGAVRCVFVLFSFCFACCILICAYPPRVWQWCSSFCLIGVLWSSQWQCCGNHHCQPLIFVPCLHYSSSLSPTCHIGSFFYARWYSVRLHVNAKDISIVVLCHSSFYYIALQMLSYLCFSWFCLHGFWSSCFCAWVLLQWLTCAVYIYMYWCFLHKNILKMMMIEDDFEDRFVNCIDKNFFFPHVCLRFNILTLFPPPPSSLLSLLPPQPPVVKTEMVTISDTFAAQKTEIATKEVPIVHTETKTITYEAAQVQTRERKKTEKLV